MAPLVSAGAIPPLMLTPDPLTSSRLPDSLLYGHGREPLIAARTPAALRRGRLRTATSAPLPRTPIVLCGQTLGTLRARLSPRARHVGRMGIPGHWRLVVARVSHLLTKPVA